MEPGLMEKLSRMVVGHEMWLENASVKGKVGRVELHYGHNMVVDGVPPEHMVNPLVHLPGGKAVVPKTRLCKKGYVLRFPIRKEGDYTVIVDSSSVWNKTSEGSYRMGPKSQFQGVTYSGAFIISAKKIVQAGESNEWCAPESHCVLDIIPSKGFLTAGKSAMMTVLYEGAPLAGAELRAYSKNSKKEELLKTDLGGKVKVPIGYSGKWMFLVRHKDEARKTEGEFDETVFVTTLVMETR